MIRMKKENLESMIQSPRYIAWISQDRYATGLWPGKRALPSQTQTSCGHRLTLRTSQQAILQIQEGNNRIFLMLTTGNISTSHLRMRLVHNFNRNRLKWWMQLEQGIWTQHSSSNYSSYSRCFCNNSKTNPWWGSNRLQLPWNQVCHPCQDSLLLFNNSRNRTACHNRITVD